MTGGSGSGYVIHYCGDLPGFVSVTDSVLSDSEVVASVFGGGGFTTVTFTGVTPFSVMPNCCAVPLETSTTRPGTIGPRSVTLTRADRPFLRFVTFAVDPSGMFAAAAVCPLAWNVVPLAVFFPSKRRPYQLAFPLNILGRALRLARSALWCVVAPGRWPDEVSASELDALDDDAWGKSRLTSKSPQMQIKLFISPGLIRFPVCGTTCNLPAVHRGPRVSVKDI